MSDSFTRFIKIIREIFQFDTADLDFGIYRILNEKRGQIEDYLNNRLPQVVDQAFAHYTESDRVKLQERLDALRQQLESAAKVFGQSAFDESGELAASLRGGEVGKEYLAVQAQLTQIEASADLKRSVYNDLANFFERYYQEGDYISKRKRGRDEKYVIPYDGQEVVLYWANQDQYYVKTGEQFRNYRFKAGGYVVQFELRAASTAQNNNKGNRYFVLAGKDAVHWDEQANTLTIYFEYRLLTEKEQQQHGRTAQQQPQNSLNSEAAAVVIAAVKDPTLKAHLALVKEGEEQTSLLKHLTQFTRRNTADFFIHKDLAAFLRRELDFFIKNEVLVLDDLIGGTAQTTGDQVRRARVVRDVGYDIIILLAQIEDFQKRLFEKKKFVTRTEYCVTIDRVPEDLWPAVLANNAQIAEWRALYALDDLLAETPLLNNGVTEGTLRQYPSLVVDTRHFGQAFRDTLLASFDDLDEATDGILISSENFQALNVLLERYREQVKCLYIDPPYNTGNDDGFPYQDSYQHSNWLALMEDRLNLGRKLLTQNGICYISIDDIEGGKLLLFMELTWGSDNRLATLARRTKSGGGSAASHFAVEHDYVIAWAKSKQNLEPLFVPYDPEYAKRYSERDKIGRYYWDTMERSSTQTKPYDIQAPDGTWLKGNWFRNEERFKSDYESGEVRFVKKNDGGWSVQFKQRMPPGRKIRSLLSENEFKSDQLDLEPYGLGGLFSYQKPVALIKHLAQGATQEAKTDYVLDFFAGSGTTGHAVIDLNREDGSSRKYILVEMGEYFETVLLPRIKKVIFSDSWKDGKPQGSSNGVSQLVKYHTLEQYEDALNSLERPRQQEGQLALDLIGDPYLLRYMLDFETQGSPSLLNIEALQSPFDYRLKVKNGLEAEPTPVDLVETFNYLLGLVEKQRRAFDHNGRRYVAVWGTQGRDDIIIIWRNTAGIIDSEEGLLADRDFIRDTIIPTFLGDGWPDRLLVNGLAMAERDGVAAESLDGLFHQLMFAGVDA